MKQLPLYNPAFIHAETGFKDWLDILGFARVTVYNLPHAVREFLHWLEVRKYTGFYNITGELLSNYYAYLKNRPNIRREGGLSNTYLNKHQQSIKKFSEYLRHTQNVRLPVAGLNGENIQQSVIDVLTVEEMGKILTATYFLPILKKGAKGTTFYKALQYRDRAMMDVFYGCGVRRNEGVQLNIQDINFSKGLMHIRKGKNYTERMVPVSRKNLTYLQAYLHEGRPVLLNTKKHDALFISARGTRMQGQTLLVRLKWIIRLTGNPVLQQKKIGLHTLRHSVATHLLAAGMQLERIKDFLGHTSLESTQIYTHLTHEVFSHKEEYSFNHV